MVATRWILAPLSGWLLAAAVLCADDKPTELTSEKVRESIRRGVGFLLSRQKPTGNWSEYNEYQGGVTALCTLALLESGVEPDDPNIRQALTYLRKFEPKKTYSTAVRLLAFAKARRKIDRVRIEEHVRALVAGQLDNGGWTYGLDRRGQPDESNTQFAVLALNEAERLGFEVRREVWNRTAKYYLDRRLAGGGWGYRVYNPVNSKPRGSMTCAGVASLIIASGRLGAEQARVEGDRVVCCGETDEAGIRRDIARAILAGQAWLAQNFATGTNPGTGSTEWLYYYFYGVERIGRLTAQRFIGEHDWYREIATHLIDLQQSATGGWPPTDVNDEIGTAFALLFLAKGRRPVVISRLEYDRAAVWNRHPSGVNHLTRYVEGRWDKDLTWQTVGIGAEVEDLLETPVLLISGGEALPFTPEQKKKLKQYVDEGGFLVIENNCGGAEFDRRAQALLAELFPENPLRKLEPNHPVWNADAPIDPTHLDRDFWLYGIDACCRTSVLYANQSLTCYWEVGGARDRETYPEPVKNALGAYEQLGANILAYATNRELKEKLDAVELTTTGDDRPIGPGRIFVAKLAHGGGADDAPAALANLLRKLEQETRLRTTPQRKLLSPDDPALFEHPILFVHGRRGFAFSPAQREKLRTYLERGGFLFGDAICSANPFAEALESEIEKTFGRPLESIPSDDPLLSDRFRGSKIDVVRMRSPGVGGPDAAPAAISLTRPQLRGLKIQDRWAVVFSPIDISCSLENSTSPECRSYVKEDAYKIGVNLLLYALQN